jgi:D-glycero-D-manno-heptose 1,7-bisphosphate phosphatase
MHDPDMAEWVTQYHPRKSYRRAAAFLDRDGTVIENIPYLNNSEKVRLIPGVVGFIRELVERDFAVVIVTNQSGIARGLCSPEQYRAVQSRVRALLPGHLIDAVYACPFLPDGLPPFNLDHGWRKPAAGMLLSAAADLDLDLSRSIMVGDSLSDMEAGDRAGVSRLVHVLTGHGIRERSAVVGAFGSNHGESGNLASRLVLCDNLADLDARALARNA